MEIERGLWYDLWYGCNDLRHGYFTSLTTRHDTTSVTTWILASDTKRQHSISTEFINRHFSFASSLASQTWVWKTRDRDEMLKRRTRDAKTKVLGLEARGFV